MLNSARNYLTLALLCLFVVSGCGDAREPQNTEPGLTSTNKDSPVGAWIRHYRDPVGQRYLEILEIYADGTYIKHAKGWMGDRGRYSLNGKIMTFHSDVDQRHNRHVRIEIHRGMSMNLHAKVPFPLVEEWARSPLQPNYYMVSLDGLRIPQGIPELLTATLAAQVRSWEPDALPTSVSIREQQNGQYALTFTFYSPARARGLNVILTRYGSEQSAYDATRAFTTAMPPDFLDLPEIVTSARASGVIGPLKRADIRTFAGHGAVWLVTTTARRGINISAESGQPIHGDVTGYIAGYEADWEHATALWRKAMEKSTPKPTTNTTNYYKYTNKSSCNYAGGHWYTSGGGFCS